MLTQAYWVNKLIEAEADVEKNSIVTEVRNTGQPHVKLIKNTKGYNWEISAYGDTIEEAIENAMAADIRLRDMYGNQ